MSKRQRVVIVVEGGVVQDVFSDASVEIVVVDFDRDAEEESVVSVFEPQAMASLDADTALEIVNTQGHEDAAGLFDPTLCG